MLNIAYDSAAHVLLQYMDGALANADYERAVQAMDRLDREGRERGHAVAMIIVLGPDTQPPNAHWRRRFAEQRKGLTAPRVFTAIVTQSAVLRGVLTAMNWISPDPPHVKSVSHGTFGEAAEWVSRLQGTPLAGLHHLLAEAEPRASRTG